ncbi:hypothetical protein GE21DRAFT_1310629 [Neurospora crassa]|nr:hypothetical protein GE21DRAFT_1310629 [Neurospora crassa]
MALSKRTKCITKKKVLCKKGTRYPGCQVQTMSVHLQGRESQKVWLEYSVLFAAQHS